MKNITLLALFAFSILGTSIAQPITEQQHLPFQKISTFTPYQQSIPDNFLFMIDDDIQKVIFNPARAGEMEKGFISTNIIPSGNQDNFSFTGLTKSNWFFSFGGNLERDDSDGEEYDSFGDNSITTFDSGIRQTGRYNTFQREFENKETDFSVDFSVSKIFSASSGSSYSIGLFAGYSMSNILRLNRGTDIRNIYSDFSQDTLYESRTDQRVTEFQDDFRTENETIVLGIEFSTFKSGTDSKHRLFIQKNDLALIDRSTTSIRNFDSFRDNQRSTTSTILDVRNDSSFMDSDPLQFRYEGFINKTVNWIGNNDYLFLKANAVYSKGEQDFFSINSNTRTYWVDDSVTRVVNERGGLNTISPQFREPLEDIEDEFKGGDLSLGYILSIQDEDLDFFTGINPYFGVYQISNAKENNDYLFDVDQNIFEWGARIPIYMSYDIKEFFSVWGGGNLSASLSKNVTEESGRFRCPPNALCSYPPPSEYSSNSFKYSESLFMGFKLSHKSGLSLVNNFRSNLTNVNSWVTSIRYSF